MKIGIVTTWFERGASYVSRQYRDVLKGRHEVFIYARGGEMPAIGDPIWDIERVTWGKDLHIPIGSAIELKDFRNWVERNRLEMVFFNEQRWWDPIILCNRLGVITGAYVDYYTEETIPLFGCYDFLICNTLRHRSAFEWHPQAFYVPWGTNLSLFAPKSCEPVHPGCVTFFHSCGYSPDRKGTELLLKAFSEIASSARLVIHSQTDLKAFFPELRVMIEDLEREGKLICQEMTVPAPGLYHLGDVYVYPSYLDGIGLTIAEALACGLPVITSDNPPMNEFIDESNGKKVRISQFFARSDGYFWPQCRVDLNHLRECMEYYVQNVASLPQLKRQARLYAEKHLDWSKNTFNVPELFENVSRVSVEQKNYAERLVVSYETRRMTIEQMLYKRSPSLFAFVRALWLLAKKWF